MCVKFEIGRLFYNIPFRFSLTLCSNVVSILALVHGRCKFLQSLCSVLIFSWERLRKMQLFDSIKKHVIKISYVRAAMQFMSKIRK